MRFSKKFAAIAIVSASALAAGAAFAYWTTSGSDSGSATTTAGVLNDLSIDNATLTAMFPGDSEQSLLVTVTNDSTESAYVTGVSVYVTTDDLACDGSNFLINDDPAPSTDLTAVALGWTGQDLLAGGSDATSGDTIQFNNKLTDQDDCKDAAVTLHYIAS